MLSIIIPQFNLAKLTEECIERVQQNTTGDFEIVVVDNGSTNVISDIHRSFVNYVRLEENVFFAAGCNAGAKAANGDILCFLNNDVMVTPNWNEAPLRLFNDYKTGLVGIKLLYGDNTIQHAGVEVYGNREDGGIFSHRYRHEFTDLAAANRQREYQSVTGAVMFIRAEDFKNVNGFDTRYINGYEDNDLCFKVRIGLEKKVVYCPESYAYHLEGQTPRNESVRDKDNFNHKYFFSKWGTYLQVDKGYWDWMDANA